MNSEASSKHEKLFYKAMYLNAELEEVTHTFDKCKADFFKEVSIEKKRPPRTSLKQAAKNLSEEIGDVLDDKVECDKGSDEPEFKSLYRKIMIKTHPDKLLQIKDEELKAKYSEICVKTMRAMENKSWFLLYGAAKDLGIKEVKLSDRSIAFLEEDCKKMNEKISVIKKSIPWVWFHSEEKIKEVCLKQYYNSL